MAGIDFSRYSVEELRQAQESIDAAQYPENYARLMAELAKPERQQQEQAESRAKEIASQDVKRTLIRIFVALVGSVTLFSAFTSYGEGVITGKHGRVIVKLADNPVGFYFGIVILVSGGLYLLYTGLTGKGLEKNIKSDIK
ncbi:hypothetical protein H1D31_11285 [Alishewanella sp. BS5-314]|uniref:hypothetical protein n=1 Tax=Alishewanella sp. BS5-314 TaxID=2755587 RepID=UPI0021BAF317|nr:hypothetical protein [Alishewanella sp. BS5-314]MCT8126597.1 hypothetical protein [Alishewanella sp. BS5-314]